MAFGSGECTESDKDLQEPLPQISPKKGKGQKCMRGIAKSSKPPKALKKKSDENLEGEIPSDVVQPEEVAQSEEVAAIEDQAAATKEQEMGSGDLPRRGGCGREPNTTDEMSNPDGYRTPPGLKNHKAAKNHSLLGEEVVQL